MLDDVKRAKIVITNYHAFKLRERIELSEGGRALLQGRTATNCNTLETEGQMLQRVMPDLMGMKNILVLNDEAHHCYREKPSEADDEDLKGDERKEAEKNNEAARLWISGLEAVKRKLGVARVIDLSATPFFLRGSGYAEGTLFPWTMSDFSLMDAIECGIVKLPRVPVADNIPGDEMPMFRNLWEHIRKDMPKKGRGKARTLDPLEPADAAADRARSALRPLREDVRALGGERHQRAAVLHRRLQEHVDLEAGLRLHLRLPAQERRRHRPRSRTAASRCSATSTNTATRSPRPNTLLIDSEQLEAGDALDDNFRGMAADEIERFRREIVERTGDARAGENITDQELLREVMNTVGKPGQLGGAIRCVVSVSMLTEGWDANTVTHVLGVRAFGTQLLCEQVIGRALRRQSYDLNEEGLFNVEYADVLGIPFDFTAKPVVAPPQPPRETIQVKAVRPERDALEIRFPRVEGYRVELPEERLTAEFNDDSILELTPDLVGPSDHAQRGHHRRRRRPEPRAPGRHAAVARCSSTSPSACSTRSGAIPARSRSSISSASSSASPSNGSTPASSARAAPIRRSSCIRSSPTWPATGSPPASLAQFVGERPIKALLDPYNPTGSTSHVSFNTSKTDRWETDARSAATSTGSILDSDWEAEFCRVAESHPRVRAYVKNHNLGLRSAVSLRLRDAQVPARLHRAGGRRPRRRRPAAPRRRDQGLPPRGRQGEEVHDGHLLGAGREPPRHATAAGRSPSSPRSIRSRLTSRPRSRASSTR